jgi:hypothetical protein
MKNERMTAMEEMMASGKKKEALAYLGLYLKEGGAPRLSEEVERALRGHVGGFSIDDIQALATLSEERASEVMEDLAEAFDPEIGMNWEQVQDAIDERFPSARSSVKL